MYRNILKIEYNNENCMSGWLFIYKGRWSAVFLIFRKLKRDYNTKRNKTSAKIT